MSAQCMIRWRTGELEGKIANTDSNIEELKAEIKEYVLDYGIHHNESEVLTMLLGMIQQLRSGFWSFTTLNCF